ncbi:substrate-binding domain-containing protein [Methylorubrum extorquens]
MKRVLAVLGCLLCVAGAARPLQGLAQPLPSQINPDTLGGKTFDEHWERLDASEMAKRPAAPTRWRTVLGAGDPSKAAYRTGSGSSIYVDATFAGVAEGRVLDKPLGLNPFRIDPGASLAIVGSKTPMALLPIMFDRPYWAGVLTTKFSFSQLFGYFEITAKLPVGKGFWPAFWLLPVRGAWPQNGELDVFEGLGEPEQIHAGIISGADHLTSSVPIKLPFKAGGPGADWHSYGVAWSADEIVAEASANWNRQQAQDQVKAWLQSGLKLDAIAANNDEMALGAAAALKAAGLSGKVLVGGVDGTSDGIAAVKSGELWVSVLQDAQMQGSQAAIDAMKLARGEYVQPYDWVPHGLILASRQESANGR